LSHFARRSVIGPLLVISLLVGLLGGVADASTPERVGPPSSMASLGDSITRGFHSQTLLTDSVQNSWSTGTNTTVNSLYNRIRTLNPSATAFNGALTGAQMNDLARQARAIPANSELVTVLLGANDACTSTEAGMTPVATYRSQFEAGMSALTARSPDALVYVASIPNIHRLWEIGRNSFGARFAWGLYSICQSMLANAGSTATADVARRERVRQRVVDFNTQLEQVCAQHLRCRFDGNAAFNTDFVLSDMSTIDYFHPNVAGQAKAARVLAAQLFDFTDTTAPTTIIDTDREADGVEGWFKEDVEVTLSSDDADLRGSEFDFRLQGAEGNLAWTRYDSPLTIDAEGTTTVTARSIDVNGNVEAGQVRDVKIDRTAPTFDLTCPAPTLLGGSADAVVSGAADALSGFVSNPNGSFPLDTSQAGTFTHQAQIQDQAGNTTTKTCNFSVVYDFGGIRQPVNADGSSIFKLGSTVPFKFGLANAAGTTVTEATATITVAKIANNVVGTETEAVSTAAATSGNAFRVSDGEYVFNLATRGLTAGTYRVTTTLTGGQQHTVDISLR
jgi:lysophospholipase L1-like esterase